MMLLPRNTCVIGASQPGSNKIDLSGMSLPGWPMSIRIRSPVRAIPRSRTSTYSRLDHLSELDGRWPGGRSPYSDASAMQDMLAAWIEKIDARNRSSLRRAQIRTLDDYRERLSNGQACTANSSRTLFATLMAPIPSRKAASIRRCKSQWGT